MKKKFLVTILSLAACSACGVALGACNKESPKPELSSITFIASDGTQNTVYSYVYADDLEVVDVSKGSVALTYTDGSSTTRAVSDFAGGELAMSYTFSPLTGDDGAGKHDGLPSEYVAGNYYIEIKYGDFSTNLSISIDRAEYGSAYTFTLAEDEWAYASIAEDLLEGVKVYDGGAQTEVENCALRYISADDWKQLKAEYDADNALGDTRLPNTEEVQGAMNDSFFTYGAGMTIPAGEYRFSLQFEDDNYSQQLITEVVPVTVQKSELTLSAADAATVWGAAKFSYEDADDVNAGIKVYPVANSYWNDDYYDLSALKIIVDGEMETTFAELGMTFTGYDAERVAFGKDKIGAIYQPAYSENYNSLTLSYDCEIADISVFAITYADRTCYSVPQYKQYIADEDYHGIEFGLRLSETGISFDDIFDIRVLYGGEVVESAQFRSYSGDAFTDYYYVYFADDAELLAGEYTIEYTLKPTLDASQIEFIENDYLSLDAQNRGEMHLTIEKIVYRAERLQYPEDDWYFFDVDGKITEKFCIWYQETLDGDLIYVTDLDKLENLAVGQTEYPNNPLLVGDITYVWSVVDGKGVITVTMEAGDEMPDSGFTQLVFTATSTDEDFADLDTGAGERPESQLTLHVLKYPLYDDDYATAQNGEIVLKGQNLETSVLVGDQFRMCEYLDLESLDLKNTAGETIGSWRLYLKNGDVYEEYPLDGEEGLTYSHEGNFSYDFRIDFVPVVSYVASLSYKFWIDIEVSGILSVAGGGYESVRPDQATGDEPYYIYSDNWLEHEIYEVALDYSGELVLVYYDADGEELVLRGTVENAYEDATLSAFNTSATLVFEKDGVSETYKIEGRIDTAGIDSAYTITDSAGAQLDCIYNNQVTLLILDSLEIDLPKSTVTGNQVSYYVRTDEQNVNLLVCSVWDENDYSCYFVYDKDTGEFEGHKVVCVQQDGSAYYSAEFKIDNSGTT